MSTFDLPRSVEEDVEAWPITPPEYRWLFNKLEVALAQGLKAAPHGVEPDHFPVISRPIYNLWGMSLGVEIWNSPDDVKYIPGHFWSELINGPKLGVHISWDLQIEKILGSQVIFRGWSALGSQGDNPGEFKTWSIQEVVMGGIPFHVREFVKTHLKDYVGWVNLECLDSYVMEVHFRACTSFIPYYNSSLTSPTYCVPLFGSDPRLAAVLARTYGIDFEDLSDEETNPLRIAAGWRPRSGLFFGKDLKVLETVKIATLWGIDPVLLA